MRRNALAATAWGSTMGMALSLGCASHPATCAGGACGGSAAAGGSAPASTASVASSGSTASSATGAGGAGGTSASGAGGTGGDALCVETGHEGACTMCCASDYSAGYATYVTALILDCACTTGAACYPQCSDAGDLCSDPSSQSGSSACIACIDALAKTDPCFTATTSSVDVACAADPSCAALTTCEQGCSGLPM